MNAVHLNAVLEWGWWTKLTCTVALADILRGSKQWWTLASKISRGSRPSNPRRIDAYEHSLSRKVLCTWWTAYCCLHRHLTYIATPGNDVMIERCLRRKDTSLLLGYCIKKLTETYYWFS